MGSPTLQQRYSSSFDLFVAPFSAFSKLHIKFSRRSYQVNPCLSSRPQLTLHPNLVTVMLNKILLVICICIVLVLVLFLFYWNRFIAYLLGILFRLSFWNQEDSSVWLDIGKESYVLFPVPTHHSNRSHPVLCAWGKDTFQRPSLSFEQSDHHHPQGSN